MVISPVRQRVSWRSLFHRSDSCSVEFSLSWQTRRPILNLPAAGRDTGSPIADVPPCLAEGPKGGPEEHDILAKELTGHDRQRRQPALAGLPDARRREQEA